MWTPRNLSSGGQCGYPHATYPKLLVVAALEGRHNIVELLLESKEIDVETESDDEWTALCWAAKRGDYELVRLLVEKYGANVSHTTGVGITPLHLAARGGHYKTVRILLAAGAKVNAICGEGFSPLNHAVRRDTEGHYETTKVLLGHGANTETSAVWQPIHATALFGNTRNLELLLSYGADISVTNGAMGWTPLTMAVNALHQGSARLLLKNGAEVSFPMREGDILSRCCQSGKVGMIDLLLHHGVGAAPEGFDYPLLWRAIQMNQVEVVNLLLERGMIPQEDGGERLLLSMASRNGFVELTKLFLDRGADTESINNAQQTALHETAERGQVETFRLLLERGANPLAVDDAGKTPLHIAAAQGHLDLVKVLLDIPGLDLARTDNNQRTALFHAAIRGDVELLLLLLSGREDPIDVTDPDCCHERVNLSGNLKDFFGTPPVVVAARKEFPESPRF